MSTITTGVGLISGIDIAGLVDALIQARRGTVERLQDRVSLFQQENQAVQTLEANVLSLSTALQDLDRADTFQSLTVNVSDPSVLRVTAGSGTAPGQYSFQAVQTAGTHELVSVGVADADQTPVGAGTLTLTTTGFLKRPTSLDLLNGGAGVRRGIIRITDRSGQSADIDLTNAYTVDDVLQAINSNTQVQVRALTDGDRLVLVDRSGSASGSLSVADVSGHAAEDLGLAGTTSGDVLEGTSVFRLTAEFSLDHINDGNGLFRIPGAPDMRITLADGTALDVSLDDARTVGDVLDAINNHADNGGKVTASLVDGHFQLVDHTAGTGTLSVQDVNGSSVVRQLGLDVSSSGGVLNGRPLLAGMSSVLLRNLRGGRGITQLGQLSLTDRTGTTAVVDLSGAESLDEVLYAINTARSASGVKLQLEARIDDSGLGIEILDTSGSTASNLVIADVGGSTLATELGIAVNAAQDSVRSGPLHWQQVSEATSLANYAPDGGPVAEGSILITDSAGNQETVYFSSAVKTIGDVLLRLNSTTRVAVRAELNETGDGIVLIDEAGGTGTLRVDEVDSTTAADLRLLGQAQSSGGQQRIVSRKATVVTVDSDDTLRDVAQKINDSGAGVVASVINTGSAVNPYRLVLRSKQTGLDGRFAVLADGTPLDFSVTAEGRNALLRVGGESGYLFTSSTNTFNDVLSGMDVQVLRASSSPVTVDVRRDTSAVQDALQTFVDRYNAFRRTVGDLTKFDPETNERGPLQGSTFVLRVTSRLEAALSRQVLGGGSVRSLADLGVTVRSDGTLKLDTERLNEVLDTDFDAVAQFFRNESNGFAKQMLSAVESLTDVTTGAFALQENSLQESIDSLNGRIDDLEAILERERERLLRQFIAMEQALGALQDQQQALTQLNQYLQSMRAARPRR